MYEAALFILKEISDLGYVAYIVGGYPRNLLLHKKATDIDICTSASPEIIKKNFQVIEDYSQFSSVKIKKNSFYFEITTFRIELDYNKGYPKIKYTNNIIEDLKRRDFTMNTFCIDKNGKILDFLNSKKDLEQSLIRIVGSIDKKLKEDPIRIIRAVRFSIELNLKIENELSKKIQQYKYLLKDVNKNRIKKELSKMNKKDRKKLEVYLCKTK